MSRTHPTSALLRTVPGLRSLDDRTLSKLASLVTEIVVEEGVALTREDALGSEAFIIVEGSAEVTCKGVHLATLGPGDFAGELALLDRRPRTATVRTASPMRLLVLNPREFRTFADTGAGARALTLQLARRLRETRGPIPASV